MSRLILMSTVEELIDRAASKITVRLAERMTESLVSLSQKHLCSRVNASVCESAANLMDRADVMQQFSDQNHRRKMKDAEKSEHDLDENTKKFVDDYANTKVGDSKTEASVLHLNVIAKDGLLPEGKGIVVEVYDGDTGKHITSDYYKGKPGTEPIKIRLTKTKIG